MPIPPEGSEKRNEMLDPHRRDERRAAAIEISGRLAQKGIEVSPDEDPAELADLLSAVEEFESAVIAAGGDLMINSPESSDPQDPRFVIPSREPGESIADYRERILAATDSLDQSG
jgi:hypothetical protein